MRQLDNLIPCGSERYLLLSVYDKCRPVCTETIGGTVTPQALMEEVAVKKTTKETVCQSKKIGGITYNVKSVFNGKKISEKMEKLIEKKIVKSSVKD